MWNYSSFDDALSDVLRLSSGMTYKAAVSGLNWGGGKSVILGDPKTQKTPELLRAFGKAVDALEGSYITAKDVGIDSRDLQTVLEATHHVLGAGTSGHDTDPSPATAWGVYQGIQVALRHQFGSPSLKGRKIVIQGMGSVAQSLIEHLLRSEAEVLACDTNPEASERVIRRFAIKRIHPESVYDISCDVFAPCALGTVLNSRTIPVLKAKVVAGCANNQLAAEPDCHELHRRGILYAPDFVINAGGLIDVYHQSLHGERYRRVNSFEQVGEIGLRLHEIFARSQAENRPPQMIALEAAKERLEQAKSSLPRQSGLKKGSSDELRDQN